MNPIYVKAGLDIGNGYSKGKVIVSDNATINANGNVDYPSVTAKLAQSAVIHQQSEADVANIISDIYNQMEASFTSPLVDGDAHYLFGKRALASGKIVQEFTIGSQISKTKQNITYNLIFASVAGAALQSYYAAYNKLPIEPLDVYVQCALSLPINEYKRNKKPYSDALTNNQHLVHFYNFKDMVVSVNIHFTKVIVTAEGAAAMVYMFESGAPLLNAMLADIRTRGIPLEGITVEDVAACKNVLGIDIGEGTVNFPVFKDGIFQPDASTTFDMGYGFTLTNALAPLSDQGLPFKNRKALADFLQQTPTALNRRRYEAVQNVVRNVSNDFVSDVTAQTSQLLQEIAAYVDLIYVYGGGATPMKEMLYPALLKEINQSANGVAIPVLYLDSQYSRNLNREGLFMLATMVQ